ncbi:MAG: MazG family protein, partial [Bdellovibrionota bacterium]
MVQPPDRLESFESLLEIVKALRGEQGCPWDKEQTHRSLTPYAIEEAHELAEAIESGSQTEVVGELGDVLLQVVLHAEIARQEKRFDITDVIRTLSEKMVRRHPHVFAHTQVSGSGEVLKNWAEIKAEEKKLTKQSGVTPLERFDVPL